MILILFLIALNLYSTDTVNFAEEGTLIIADAYYNIKKYDIAEKILKRFLIEYPKSKKYNYAKLRIAQCYFSTDRYEDALKLCKDIVEKSTEDEITSQARFLMMYIYLQLGKHEELVQEADIFSVAHSTHDSVSDVLYFKSIALVKQKRYADAIEVLKDFIKKYPGHKFMEDVQDMLSTCYYELQQFDDMAKVCYSLLESKNANIRVKAMYKIAWNKKRLKKYREALPLYQEIIKKYPESEFCQFARMDAGDCYFHLKQYPEAVDQYKSVIENVTTDTELGLQAIDRIYEILRWEKKYNPGITLFSDLIEKQTNEIILASLRVKLAVFYYYAGEYSKALLNYEKVKATFPERLTEEDYYFIAESLYNSKKLALAVDSYLELLSLYPESKFRHKSITNIANIYLELEDKVIAEKLRNIAEKYPETKKDKAVALSLARIHKLNKEFQKAITYFEVALEKYKTEKMELIPVILLETGECYQGMGKYRDALVYYGRILHLYSSDEGLASKSLYKIGECYEGLEMIKERNEIYGKLIEKYPKTKYADLARKKIEK